MKEYDVWYAGMVVGNLYATSKEDASEKVKEQFSKGVFGYPEAVLA